MCIPVLVAAAAALLVSEPILEVVQGPPMRVRVHTGGGGTLESPAEGLWSVATGWSDGWPSGWHHAAPESVRTENGWTVLEGHLDLAGGRLELRDSYRVEGDLVLGRRRFEWKGTAPLPRCSLSVRWIAPDADPGSGPATGAVPFLPGISFNGNPFGAMTSNVAASDPASRGRAAVVVNTGAVGERSYHEEHRYSIPFASVEWPGAGAALHTTPSPVPGAARRDQWWSLGVTPLADGYELAAYSGPCAANGRNAVVKARQGEFMAYDETWLELRPGAVVEKEFALQVFPVARFGDGFRAPLATSIARAPLSCDGLPSAASIVRDKLAFARSRWRDRGAASGFEMYPDYVEGTHYVMGWCGQAETMPYYLLAMGDDSGWPAWREVATTALDLLVTAPFDENGFRQRYTVETGKWTEQDFVSQGQALETISRAIDAAERRGVDASRWKSFLRRACELHARRVLQPKWIPVSTNEAFLVSPLLRAARILESPICAQAGIHVATVAAERHIGTAEPYWGGTLDAECEDKEGAWAAFQAFLACFDHTGDVTWLRRAEHAMDATLSWTVLRDIDLPPGRLRDHAFASRGWTVVSAQNQHLDVFGVFYAPEVYRMGRLLGRDELCRLAKVMFRSCGQLIDEFGSQGEQIQQTNFAQHGDMSDVERMRGGYSEGWTVLWITTHFLHAAARFHEMGVDLDRADAASASADVPAPLFRDPPFDGAADPVVVFNPSRGAWWMLYTQRRARLDLPGVEWCHQTKLGVAESTDGGATWRYLGTLPLPTGDEPHSLWAPDVVRGDDGCLHLFVTIVPGVHVDWSGSRFIDHYVAADLGSGALGRWTRVGRLPLTSDRCIDPSLFRKPGGGWRLWYKDEAHGSATLAVDSDDLATWAPAADPGVSKLYGEAPKVFALGGFHWLLKDPDSGLDVYRSQDLAEWTYQGKILDTPGTRLDDGSIGKHADVVVAGDRAMIVYFTHPYGQDFPMRDGVMPYPARRSSIQCAELRVVDGVLTCDRNAPVTLRLRSPFAE
jgi:hypothetical protein